MFINLLSNIKGKGEFLLVAMLLLFFSTDALNVIISGISGGRFGYTSSYTMLSSLSKGLFLFCYFGYALLYRTKEWVITIGTIFSFGLIAHLIYSNAGFSFYFTWIIHVAKIILPFLLYELLISIRINPDNKVFKVFTSLVFIQSVVVVFALIFGIELFRTYNASRFGYSGLLQAQNEATFYYVIAYVFLYRQWELQKERIYLVLMFLVLIASTILGTKAIFIFHVSLMLYVTLNQNRFNKFILLGVFFVLGTGLLYLLYLFGAFDFFIASLHKKDWLTMITSVRNLLIQERLPDVFARWEWYNYLFGGLNPNTSFVEMDLIDLFTFGGVVGSFIFYYMLFKTLFKFNGKNYLGWLLVTQYFVIGGLAGHVFASGINAIYLALTCYYLQLTEEKSELDIK